LGARAQRSPGQCVAEAIPDRENKSRAEHRRHKGRDRRQPAEERDHRAENHENNRTIGLAERSVEAAIAAKKRPDDAGDLR